MRWKVGIVLCVIALIIGWWLRGHHHAATATSLGVGSGVESHGGVPAHHRGPQAPATLSGKVTHKADGGAVAGATVAIARAELGAEILPSQAPTLVVTTSATGTWTSPVAPGTYIIAATSLGFLPGTLPKLVVGEGERRAGLDLALEAGGTVVKGTVSDVGGGPIDGARITIKDNQDFSLSGHADFVAMTAADGTYQMSVRDGSYRIGATQDDYTKALSGQPVSGITVIAGGLEDGRGFADVLAGKAPTTDASGHFRVERVAAGSGSLTFMPATGGFEPLALKGFTAAEGQLVDVGVIKVVPPRNGDAGTFGLVTGPTDAKLAVVSVAPGGPAEQAGITTADVITQLDGHPISQIGAGAAAALLSSGRVGAGTTIALTLERGTTVTLTAAKW